MQSTLAATPINRFERYLVAYTWKALEGQFPECGIKYKSNEDSRLEILCHVPTIVNNQQVKTIVSSSWSKTVEFFPKSIRHTTGYYIDTFKQKLDSYISDQLVIWD